LSPLLFVTDVEAISGEFRGRINKSTEVSMSMENIWKSKNITNDTKNVHWKQQRSMQSGHTTNRSETICGNLRCSVTKESYVSVGQSKKQTVKHVKNSELKRICYKEPFKGHTNCLATYAGWRATGS